VRAAVKTLTVADEAMVEADAVAPGQDLQVCVLQETRHLLRDSISLQRLDISPETRHLLRDSTSLERLDIS
jgi:hypothetical protein